MADGTRHQVTLQDMEKAMTQKLLDSNARLSAEFNSKMETMASELKELIIKTLSEQPRKGIDGKDSSTSNFVIVNEMAENRGSEDINGTFNRLGQSYRSGDGKFGYMQSIGCGVGTLSTRLSKIEFPKFDGTMLKEWLYKCEQFFSLDNTPPETKVRLASIHLDGKALQWHHTYMVNRFNQFPSWPEYITDISARFGNLFDDPMADLVGLRQSGDVQEYLDEFESILARVALSPQHALSIFLSGLQLNTQLHIRMFKPTSLQQAAHLAKLYEASQKETLSTNKSSSKAWTHPQFFQNNTKTPPPYNPQTNPITSPKPNTTPILDKPPRRLTPAEIDEKRAKNLCFICDEPFTPGHHLKHKRAQLFIMEGSEHSDEKDEDVGQAIIEELHEGDTLDTPHISVHAIYGSTNYPTMRITGVYNNKPLHILVDSGSTHNFLDEGVALRLGCTLISTKPMTVSVADGSSLMTVAECKNFQWHLQNTKFSTDFMLLPLGYCDMLLGIQWLQTLGPILWDFNNLQMEFTYGGKRHVLRGSPTSIKIVKGQPMGKNCDGGPQLAVLQLISVDEPEVAPSIFSKVEGTQALPPKFPLFLQHHYPP